MNKLRLSFITGYSFLLIFNASSQYHIGDTLQIDYSYQKEYEIGGITISGIKYLDKDALLQLSGLNPGDIIMVPGEEIADAIRKLWKQSLFSDIQISVTKIIGNKIFLDIFLQEQPRLSKFTFSGMKKSEVDDIREKLKLTKGRQVTENLLNTIENKTKDYFIDKGFLNATVNIIQEDDTALLNNVILNINIEKRSKIKINNIFVKNT
ncbi:MAG: hypothetical protein HY738_20630 [Bacteroidia bacterium]|nr:hypothetical protein [Bacteroidia bacterium]